MMPCKRSLVAIAFFNFDLQIAWIGMKGWEYSSFASELMHWSIRRIWQAFLTIMAFNLRWFTQNRRNTSFFGANTISEVHSDCASSMTFIQSIFSISILSNYQALALYGRVRSSRVRYPSKWDRCNAWRFRIGQEVQSTYANVLALQ